MIDSFWLLWHPVNIESLLLCLATQTFPVLVRVAPLKFCSCFPVSVGRVVSVNALMNPQVETWGEPRTDPLVSCPCRCFLLRVFKLDFSHFSLKSFHCSQPRVLIQKYCCISFSLVGICQAEPFFCSYILGTYLVHGRQPYFETFIIQSKHVHILKEELNPLLIKLLIYLELFILSSFDCSPHQVSFLYFIFIFSLLLSSALESFMSTWHRLTSFYKGETKLRTCPHQIACRKDSSSFPYLLIDRWGPSSLGMDHLCSSGPGCSMKTSKGSY